MSITRKSVREVPGRHSEESPKRSTIAFLQQFARCYSFEPRINCGAGSMILN